MKMKMKMKTHLMFVATAVVISTWASHSEAQIKPKIRTVAECRARVVNPAKRSACVRCVQQHRPHQYWKSARPGVRCLPYAYPVGGEGKVARNAANCRGQMRGRAQRAACLTCVRRAKPHAYFKDSAPGKRCRRLLGSAPRPGKVPLNAVGVARPAGPTIYKLAGCSRLAHPARQSACRACVGRKLPHRYKAAAAPGRRCVRHVKPVRLMAVGEVVTTKRGCNKRTRGRAMRARCIQCVTKKIAHYFKPKAPVGKRCTRGAVMGAIGARPSGSGGIGGLGGLGGRPRVGKGASRGAGFGKGRGGPPPPRRVKPGVRSLPGCKYRVGTHRSAACRRCVLKRPAHAYYVNRKPGQRCVREPRRR